MKGNGPKTEPWGTPQVRSEGDDFYYVHSYYLCPNLQVRTEEGQSQLTNTEKCFRSESEYLPLVSAWFNPQHKQHAHSNKTHEYNTIRHVQNKQQPYSKTLWVRGELLHDPVVH